MYSGIYMDFASRYRLDSVLCIDQCTLQYWIRLLNSGLKIFSVNIVMRWCTLAYVWIWQTDMVHLFSDIEN